MAHSFDFVDLSSILISSLLANDEFRPFVARASALQTSAQPLLSQIVIRFDLEAPSLGLCWIAVLLKRSWDYPPEPNNFMVSEVTAPGRQYSVFAFLKLFASSS